jgi:hypothetical protein
MKHGKSWPHKNEVKIGHKSHKFTGHSVGHVKGKPGSGVGGKCIVPTTVTGHKGY